MSRARRARAAVSLTVDVMADFDDESTPLPPATPYRGDDGLVTGAMIAIVPGANHPYAASHGTTRMWALSAGAAPEAATTRMTRAEILEAIPGMHFAEQPPARAEPLVPPATDTVRVDALRPRWMQLGVRARLVAAGAGLFVAGLLVGLALG